VEDVFSRLRELGDDFSPQQIVATRALFVPLVPRPHAGAIIERDLEYGPDPRQRLDVFSETPGERLRPVVVFFHGGGFVTGDKGDATAPFFNNVGAWALREGFVGVTVSYRLAPAHVWPSGAEDVALVVRWLQQHIASRGGDPRRIVVAGQSAGASHVGAYVARHERPPIAGAAMFSGLFDITLQALNANQLAYYGADASLYPERSTIAALATTSVPCFYTVSELDPATYHEQVTALGRARFAATRRSAELLHLGGHNHVSSVMQVGSAVDTLGGPLAAFVRRVSALVEDT
jgi:acetyl esterase/lipase